MGDPATNEFGVASLLAVVTLRQHTAGADMSSLVTVGQGLVAVHDWTFLLGPNFVCVADTLVLAYAMWRSRLVSRFIAGLGLASGSPERGKTAPNTQSARHCHVDMPASELQVGRRAAPPPSRNYPHESRRCRSRL
jgi:hypothetical protein